MPKQIEIPAGDVAVTDLALKAYDAGLLNDFGGGNVEWWQDYIRAELERAHEHYQSQAADALAVLSAVPVPDEVEKLAKFCFDMAEIETLQTLQTLIYDMSGMLADEIYYLSDEGLTDLRRRTANALDDKCPEWLERYRDPAITGGA